MISEERVIQAENLKVEYSRNADKLEEIIAESDSPKLCDLIDYLDLHYEIVEDLEYFIYFYGSEENKITAKEFLKIMKTALHLMLTTIRMRVYEVLYIEFV